MVKSHEVQAAAGEAFDTYRALKRFSCLDGLRFFCIMAVLWHHAPVYTTMAHPAAILTRGFLGVDFFFVLSGFLITTLLLREETRRGWFSLRGFYWRRILRIIPIYFFVVFLAAFYAIGLKGEAYYAQLVPYYLLFLANFLKTDIPLLAPTWSLAVEEQYYLFWPLLLLLLPRRMVLPALGVMIGLNVAGIMGLLSVFGVHAFDWGPLHIALPNATYAPILMGSAVAILLHDRGMFIRLLPVLGHRLAPIVAFAGLMLVIQVAPPDIRGLPNLAIHLMMSIALITLVIRDDNILKSVMIWRPVARIGEISYGIYLYHLFALSLVDVGLRHLSTDAPWAVFVFYVPLSIAVSEISYRTLERFFRQFRHRVPGRASPV